MEIDYKTMTAESLVGLIRERQLKIAELTGRDDFIRKNKSSLKAIAKRLGDVLEIVEKIY